MHTAALRSKPEAHDSKPVQAWSNYEEKLNHNQDDYNRKLEDLYSKVPVVKGLKSYHPTQPLASGVERLNKLVRNRYKLGLYKICEEVSSLVPYSEAVNHQAALDAIVHLFSRKMRSYFESIRSGVYIFKQQQEEVTHTRNLQITREVRESAFIKFARLVDNFFNRVSLQRKNTFMNKIISIKLRDMTNLRAMEMERALSQVIRKTVAPCFKKIQTVRRGNYKEETVSNFMEVMNYYFSDKKAQGFASIRSFMMQFEVLKVEEIDQDDYKNLIMDAVEKVKVLSERSFDMGNLSGVGLDDPRKIENMYMNQSINVLEPSTIKDSSRMLNKRATISETTSEYQSEY